MPVSRSEFLAKKLISIIGYFALYEVTDNNANNFFAKISGFQQGSRNFSRILRQITTMVFKHALRVKQMDILGVAFGKTNRKLSVKVFNRELKQRQRERSLLLPDGHYYDYLREESASNIVDRVEDITKSFPKALEIGSYRGSIHSILASRENLRGNGGIGGVTELVQAELAAITTIPLHPNATDILPELVASSNMIVDEENELPFPDQSFDLVLSSLCLHWVNDLPSTLLQIKRVLRPDGAFIASMLGGDTLKELRYCFYLAEKERRGRVSSHASPMAKASDVAALMQGAGFALPTVDIDIVTVRKTAWDVLICHR